MRGLWLRGEEHRAQVRSCGIAEIGAWYGVQPQDPGRRRDGRSLD